MFENQPVPDAPTPLQPPKDSDSLPFQGYHRSDGSVGTRNYWLVIPLFSESTPQLSLLKDALLTVLGYNSLNPYLLHLRALREQYRAGSYFEAPLPPVMSSAPIPLFENIDGVKFLPGLDWPALTASTQPQTTQDVFWPVLTGYCTHPNVGGITLLCRPGTTHVADMLWQYIHRQNPAFAKPVLVVEQPVQPSEFDSMPDATREMFQAMTVLNRQTRRPTSVSRLTVGVQCGQTDGFSTYPAIGQYASLLAEAGATVLLADPYTRADFRQVIAHPCSNFRTLPERGLQVLHLPGDAAEITTALTAAGCTLHLAMSASGQSMGNPIAPVAELAAAQVRPHQLAQHIDLDGIDSRESSVSQRADIMLKYSLELASGKQQTQSESRGRDEFKLYQPASGQ